MFMFVVAIEVSDDVGGGAALGMADTEGAQGRR